MVDWELCTLGDPLADVGLLMAYWPERGDDVVALGMPANLAPGFPTQAEIAARYAERSGRDLSDLDFYVALGYWKLAIILEGVYARYVAGGYGKVDEGVHAFATPGRAPRRRGRARPSRRLSVYAPARAIDDDATTGRSTLQYPPE